mmetsp:Transcript_7222/g.19752  ORF Transcript_7222/g.19752 Transcript_7222/m.19752 type:complete len:91 (+) Transcript_7222:949-1221(+)
MRLTRRKDRSLSDIGTEVEHRDFNGLPERVASEGQLWHLTIHAVSTSFDVARVAVVTRRHSNSDRVLQGRLSELVAAAALRVSTLWIMES